jgi:hypothetical protein
MQRNYCSSVVLLGAVAALLAGCGGRDDEEPVPQAKANQPSACESATADDLVGPTWTVDNAPCGVGCDHAHVEVDHKYTFTKAGANFDIHGSYETSGGALEQNPNFENEVRGKIRMLHTGGGEIEHWLTAQLYIPNESRCGTPTPYDLRIAVCENEPNSFDACKSNGQHGGYAHSHP